MKNLVQYILCKLILLGSLASASSQEVVESVYLEGPRIGFTVLPSSQAQRVREYKGDELEWGEGMTISQFGWQFEEQFIQFSSGGSMVLESVLLIGGLEKSIALPSASFIIGSRSASGFEVGVGPNLSVSGAALVFAAGVTIKNEDAFIPINMAFVSSEGDVRFSLLIGFNARKK